MKLTLRLKHFIDLNGGLWLGLYSWVMLMGFVGVFAGKLKDIPAGVSKTYMAVLTAYAASKTVHKVAKVKWRKDA